MYEEPDTDFESHDANVGSTTQRLKNQQNGTIADGTSSSRLLPDIRPSSRRPRKNHIKSDSPQQDESDVASNYAWSTSSRGGRPYSNPARLANSPYVGDIRAANRRRRSPSPTHQQRSQSHQRVAVSSSTQQNSNTSALIPTNHSGFEPKVAEDYLQELLNTKKAARTLATDNQALKIKCKRLQEENLRRNRELEEVLERAPESEFAVPQGSSAAVIKRLKTRLLRTEILLKETQSGAINNSTSMDRLPPAASHKTSDENGNIAGGGRRRRASSIDMQLQEEIDTVKNQLDAAMIESKQLKQKCTMLESWLNEKNTKLNHILDERLTLQSTLSEREEALRKLRRQLALLKRRRNNKQLVTIKDEPETRFFSPAASSSASSRNESAQASADEQDTASSKVSAPVTIVTTETSSNIITNGENSNASESDHEKSNAENLASDDDSNKKDENGLKQVEEPPSILAEMESSHSVIDATVISTRTEDANDEQQEFLRNECAAKLRQVFRAHLARLEYLNELRRQRQDDNFTKKNSSSDYAVERHPEKQETNGQQPPALIKNEGSEKMHDSSEYSFLVKKLQALLRAHLERVRYLSGLPRV